MPIEDRPEEPRRRFPYVVLALILMNVLVFVYELSLSPVGLNVMIDRYGARPAAIVGGAGYSLVPAYVTVFSALFIHGGFLHLAGNMIFLWVFGDNVESAFGHLTFLAFYLAAGVAAFATQTLLEPSSKVPAIGASGAIAGVLAAYVMLFPRAPVRVLLLVGPFFTLGRTAALPLLAVWFLLQLFQGAGSLQGSAQQAGGIAYFAHVGGFLFGIALTAVVLSVRHQTLGRFAPFVWWDRDLRNWVLVVGCMLAALALAALVGRPAAGRLQILIVGLAAGVAVGDGLLRASGRRGLVGEGHGFAKLLAIVQVCVALAVLLSLLLT